MKLNKVLALALAILLALAATACAAAPAATAPATEAEADVAMQYITADELEAALGTPGYRILDVRKAADYDIAHIVGSTSVDMDAAKEGDAAAGIAAMTAATQGVTDTLVLVCYSGKKYAQVSTNSLASIGYDLSKVLTLEGGFNNWIEAKPALVEPAAAAEAPAIAEPTLENPLVVDAANKTVALYTEVNGAYFTEPTRHGVVFKDGGNGDKAILRSYADEKQFYQVLFDFGATPGNNLTGADMGAKPGEGKAIEGDLLNVTVKWAGQDEIPFENIIKASEARPMEVRFGGNIETANAYNTGCTLCLDSCMAGITSNAAWTSESTANGLVTFYGDDSVLPADGTAVIVIFRLA
ncbi:MAG: YdjY domain-containing protein [Christensenellaceae bacterium]|nr:YdjY domain-containing protein [Christensenellaceae bacterium]